MAAVDQIRKIVGQLYPKGRAFKMPYAGIFYRLNKALAISEAAAYEAARSVLDSALPDNDNFTIEDARDWYRRLGIYDSGSVPLADMKAAILRKIKHPGTIKARGNYRYIEEQLRLANFDVHVYENKFLVGPSYVTQTPQQILNLPFVLAQVGTPQVGDTQVGTESAAASNITIIANHIEEEKDFPFVIGSNYRSTFFIAGATVDAFAQVDINRKIEFRQLILKLKPLQAIGYLFVEYV